jgi:hypothetical protein
MSVGSSGYWKESPLPLLEVVLKNAAAVSLVAQIGRAVQLHRLTRSAVRTIRSSADIFNRGLAKYRPWVSGIVSDIDIVV